jgi:cyclase
MLWKDMGLVKGVGFDSWRRVGTVLPAIRVYTLRQVDEIIFVDIAATRAGREPDFDAIEEFTRSCSVPITIGGGISKIEDIMRLLRCGADKVSINSASYSDPEIVREGAKLFGSQCIVASIDAKRLPDGSMECFSHSGTVGTGRNPVDWAKALEEFGAGEILLTSIDNDGTMKGYDLDLIRDVANSVSIPVIASGGAGSYEDMLKAIRAGASAVAAASIYHFTEQTPLGAKEFLALHGVPVRLIDRGRHP